MSTWTVWWPHRLLSDANTLYCIGLKFWMHLLPACVWWRWSPEQVFSRNVVSIWWVAICREQYCWEFLLVFKRRWVTFFPSLVVCALCPQKERNRYNMYYGTWGWSPLADSIINLSSLAILQILKLHFSMFGTYVIIILRFSSRQWCFKMLHPKSSFMIPVPQE
jgi:hypothetical protein